MIVCPHCSRRNVLEAEVCVDCGKQLLVISGLADEETPIVATESSLDEHLIERVSMLEDALRNTVRGLQRSLRALRRLERGVLVNQAGLDAIEALLHRQGLVEEDALRLVWDDNLRGRLLAMEKRDFLERQMERIVADFAGNDLTAFQAELEDALEAFAALDSEAALRHLERALDLDQANPELASLVGELAYADGQRERALAHFSSALERDADQYEALVFSGILLQETGRLEEARRRLRRAVEVGPERFLGWFGLGSLCADSDELREATVYLERAVEIDRVPTAMVLLGRTYRRMGKLGRATAILEEATAADPMLDDAHYELGRTFARRGWRKRGTEALTTALELSPRAHDHGAFATALEANLSAHTAAATARRASILVRDGSDGAGRDEMLAEVRRESDPVVRAFFAAVVIETLRAQGRLRDGVTWGERWFDDEDAIVASVARGEVAHNLVELEDSLDRALRLAEEAAQLSPPQVRSQVHATLGWVHFRRGEVEKAARKLEEAVAVGENVGHRKLLGIVRLGQGEIESANEIFEQADALANTGLAREKIMLDHLHDDPGAS